MSYTNTHRYLLRTIASRGVLTLLEAEELIRKFSGNTDSITDMVKQINDEIRPFHQSIKITSDELTEEQVVIFLSLGFDEATKSQSFFKPDELEYFRLLIEEIMSTEMRQISGMYAMNLVSKMKSSFTKSEAQRLLDLWCKMRYMDNTDNQYALGVRAIHEFESYLRQNMPDIIEECSLCKQVVFRGCNCPACGLAVHTRCLNHYLEKVERWPCCKVDYSASQLARNNTERLSQVQTQNDGQESQTDVADTQQSAYEDNISQLTTLGISQSAKRKRRRL